MLDVLKDWELSVASVSVLADVFCVGRLVTLTHITLLGQVEGL